MRPLLLTCPSVALAAGLLVLPSGAWAQAPGTPEAAAERNAELVRAGDWDGIAALMHPDALVELGQFLRPLLRMPEAEGFRAAVFGVQSEEALLALPDEQLFAGFLGFAMTQDPAMASSLASAQVKVLGHVMEGDTAHVVARTTITVEDFTVSTVDVASFRQDAGEWRGLLTADITSLATALQVALERAAASNQADAEGPYDAAADPHRDIEEALQASQADQKLVLLDFGANWCSDCLVLDGLFQDPAVAEFLDTNFRVVHVDVGRFDRNLDVSEAYGDPIANGVPAVVVLTPSGEIVASTGDGSLEAARTTTAPQILELLQSWVAAAHR